jgi:hypothetical protein
MEILYDITKNVNDKHSSKDVFLNKDLHTIIENLSLQDQLSLLSTANKDRLVKRLSNILDRKEIDMEKDLSSFKSRHTRTAYSHSLKVYLGCCARLAVDPRLATYETARDFVVYLTNKGSSSVVIRQTVSIVKTFYEYLLDIHELHVGNPFSHKPLLPRKERIKPLVIPTFKTMKRY